MIGPRDDLPRGLAFARAADDQDLHPGLGRQPPRECREEAVRPALGRAERAAGVQADDRPSSARPSAAQARVGGGLVVGRRGSSVRTESTRQPSRRTIAR